MKAVPEGGAADWEDDPIVREAVEEAVAPYAAMVSPAYLQAMRAAVADHLLMHPATELLIRSLRERAAPQQSGEEPMGVAEEAAGRPPTKKAAGDGT